MTEPTPPAEQQPPSDGTAASAASAGSHRGAHRAPAKPQRWIGLGLIVVAAIIALLVAFSSCSTDDPDQTPIPGPVPTTTAATTPPATTAPPTTAPATTAPATTRPPTTAPATTAPPTTPPPTTAPATNVARIPVDVRNGTRTTGLAARAAAQVRAAGWTVASVGNWRSTTVGDTTIFYGSGDQAVAQRLARELSGDQEVAPALSGMSTTRLTLVVG
jgi:type IV secretory pathway VirB10-like protein